MKERKKIDYGELIIPGLVVGYIVYTLFLQISAGYQRSTVIYGLLLSIPLLVCSVYIAVDAGARASDKAPLGLRPYYGPAALLLANVVMVLLMHVVGYLICFFVYLVVLMRFYEVKSWLKIACISIGTVALIHAIFGMWMELPLPEGIFFAEE